jgi:flagellar protein FliL
MANTETTENAAPSGGGGKIGKLLLPIFLLINFASLGAGLYLVFINTIEFEPPKIVEEHEKELLSVALEEMESDVILYNMEPFTVNLAGFPSRAIKLEMSLEMLDTKGFEDVVRLGAESRDSIVKILNAKRFADIETIQGKLFLKDQIATTLNSFLKEGVVKEVYFTYLAVQ